MYSSCAFNVRDFANYLDLQTPCIKYLTMAILKVSPVSAVSRLYSNPLEQSKIDNILPWAT